YVQHRAAAVQAAFGKHFPRANIAGARNLQLREITANPITTRDFDGSSNGDAEPVRHIDDDVAHGSLQPGVGKTRASRQGGNDSAAAALNCGWAFNFAQINGAPASLRFDLALALVHLDGSAASLQRHQLSG